ncbi:MAG: RNase adapter RapZ [Bacteroidota bacterium]
MNTEEKVSGLYREWCGSKAVSIEKIAGSGSYRQYFRLNGTGGNVVAALNADIRENLAFIEFTRHFAVHGLPVPQLLYVNPETDAYLLQDLGDTTLFSALNEKRSQDNVVDPGIAEFYMKVAGLLPSFQVTAGRSIPFQSCYPRPAFDRQSMMWDLSYFKYYFLKLARISFDEQKLEEDFNALCDFLLEVPFENFMYRDFQSRNIMIFNDTPWFIDYQGGRKGGLQYDLASLLYDAKADLPEDFRMHLMEHYLEAAGKAFSLDEKKFVRYFDAFVLIRILQAMGAYGFRGYYENKPLFLQSIPYAVRNLRILIDRNRIPVVMPMLFKALAEITGNPSFSGHKQTSSQLIVKISSFSFKNGIPADESGNGGGFVFDCRALPNPGRYPEYREVTGKDQSVIDFLGREAEVDVFLNHVFSLVNQSVRKYIERGFTSLMVSFGCTGGQHRSVYCAEQMAKHLGEKFNVNILVKHEVIGD